MCEEFAISSKNLEQLFIQDNIRSGKSLEILHSLQGIAGLFQKLQTSPTKGISNSHSSKFSRELIFGNNHPFIHKRRTIAGIVFDILQDTVLQILIAASVLSLIMGIIQDPTSG